MGFRVTPQSTVQDDAGVPLLGGVPIEDVPLHM